MGNSSRVDFVDIDYRSYIHVHFTNKSNNRYIICYVKYRHTLNLIFILVGSTYFKYSIGIKVNLYF